MSDLPYLNLGAGRIILPCQRPDHHAIVDEDIYSHPQWVNADRNAEPGVDCVVDLFTYPWPWQDNSFAGALASHIVEHIPHEIKTHPNGHEGANRIKALSCLQDGWYAFFSELYRVLEPGAIVHILAPYGFSGAGITDPTHTRYITENTFGHSMTPDPGSPFKYATGNLHFEMVAYRYAITPMWSHLLPTPDDNLEAQVRKQILFVDALETHLNVAYEIYAKLKVIK